MLTIQPISICLLYCSLISYSLLIVLIYNRICFFASLAMTTILILKFQKLNALLPMMDNNTMTFHKLKAFIFEKTVGQLQQNQRRY